MSEPPATVEAGPNIAAPSADNLAARLLGVAEWPLRLAPRFLGRRAARLGLGSCPLRLHSARLRLRRRLLGLLGRPSRRAVRAGLFRRGRVYATQFLLLACDSDQPGRCLPAISSCGRNTNTTISATTTPGTTKPAGFHPSYSYNSGRSGYDPIYAHERWQHRQDNQWEHRVAADFQNRRDHEEARPPRTWTAQRALGAGDARSREKGPAVAVPFSQFTKNPNSPQRFQPVDPLERQKLGQHGQDVKRFRDERLKAETRVATPSTEQPSKQFTPARAPLSRSPIVARSGADLGKGHAPPQAHEGPKPDLRIEAKPRAVRPPEQSQQRTVNQQPQPRVERLAPQRQPQPKADRPAPQRQPQPKADRPAPERQPQPKADRPAPERQPQPKADRPAPQRQQEPKADRPAPQRQPQPKADRPAPEPRGNSAGSNQDKHKDKDKGKGKDK